METKQSLAVAGNALLCSAMETFCQIFIVLNQVKMKALANAPHLLVMMQRESKITLEALLLVTKINVAARARALDLEQEALVLPTNRRTAA